jgi:hypothetical protein
MPSLLHEGLIQLVRDRPELVATLLTDLLGVPVPPFTKARLEEAALPELVPVSYQADMVVLLVDGDPVFGVILEAQLQPDPRKRFTWPFYAVAARARHECPFVVVVATPDPDTARWAAQPIDLGGGNRHLVQVIGPDGVPAITDVEHAVRDPYLAMLSVIAHGQGDQDVALAIATATAEALHTLPRQDQRLLYWFIILSSLGEAARKAFEMLSNIQPFLTESQRQLVAEGMAKAKAEAKAEDIVKILAKRGILLSDDRRRHILACSDLPTLDRWFDQALSVATADELFE